MKWLQQLVSWINDWLHYSWQHRWAYLGALAIAMAFRVMGEVLDVEPQKVMDVIGHLVYDPKEYDTVHQNYGALKSYVLNEILKKANR